MIDQQLPVRVRTGTETHDDAVFCAFGDQLAQAVGDHFEQDGEGARFFELLGVVHDLLGQLGALALHAESAQSRDGLRRQPQVSDGRDAGVDDASDAVGHGRSAFQLDGITARLGHEAPGAADGGFDAGLVGHVRHVTDQEGGRRAAPHGLRVADHVVHGDRQGRIVAQHGHAQAVADQDHFDARLFLQVGGRVIVTGEPGDRLALGDFLEQIRQCDFLAWFGHGLLLFLLFFPSGWDIANAFNFLDQFKMLLVVFKVWIIGLGLLQHLKPGESLFQFIFCN